MPLSTLVLGAALVALSFQRFAAIDEQNALERAESRRDQAEVGIRRSLAAADALLDRVRVLSRAQGRSQDPTELAFSLAALATRRAGLTWLSLSFPDGTFKGVYREGDGSLAYQESRLQANETRMQQFSLGDGRLLEKARKSFHYDPRERSFYRLALAEKQRVWTQPYTFYPDFRTGITRTEALFESDGSLACVLTADYDVSELSSILSEVSLARETLVLFTHDGVVLGVSGLSKDPRQSPTEQPLGFGDLGNEELAAFFRTRGNAPAALREFTSQEHELVAIEHRLNGLPGLDWRLATVLPKLALVATARRHARNELWLASGVVLFAVALATALSFGVRRLRRARAQAEARSEQALGKLRELGAYTLGERLGSGGMGEVYRAEHRMLARPAAIKLIRTDLPSEERAALEQRFEREAKALAELRSPHTVSILDYGRTTDDRLYIAMELLVGLPLDRLIEKYGAQPASRVIPILVGVCRSLSEAHAAGIVHRDIKPANLFLCHDAEGVELVKVLDFGLAKSERRPGVTRAGNIAGTPHFMSPEQALGRSVDGRTDLYALGCTAYYLLTAKNVFEEPSEMAVMLAHQLKTPEPLQDHCEQWLPAGFSQLIQRCLAKDPEFRPVSAAALARALLSLPIPHEHESTPETWREWWKSREGDAPAPA